MQIIAFFDLNLLNEATKCETKVRAREERNPRVLKTTDENLGKKVVC